MTKPLFAPVTLITLGLAGSLFAEESISPEHSATATTPAVAIKISDPSPETTGISDAEAASSEKSKPSQAERAVKREERMKKEQERLALENSLADERVKRETAKLRAEIIRLKTEKELIAERLALAAQKRAVDQEAENSKAEAERQRLERDASIAKAKAELLTHQLKTVQAESGIEITRLQGQIQQIEISEKRKGFANGEPEYLKQPLKSDGILVISDRRIALNGAITTDTADRITDRIHYFNNLESELPIFIVIDECPGGSVMAGYRILKAMEASKAPIHVVVKSFAASMAAAITTLAEESYAYPNAVILHHQISATVIGRMNLTQQEEFFKESKRWWDRLATPIADKMGMTKEELIKKMYEQSTSGDWSEFGVEAQKLKWVKHIVTGIDETSFRRNPDEKASKAEKASTQRTGQVEALDEEGRPVMYLPRINPKDVYFLYNPDGYYRTR